jgi:hypothetical protein
MRRTEIAAALELRRRIARILDDATVALLAVTSSPAAVIRAAYEERGGVPAYDDAPGIKPTDVLKACPYCCYRFWSRGPSPYCSASCSARDRYRHDSAHREQKRAYNSAAYRRRSVA